MSMTHHAYDLSLVPLGCFQSSPLRSLIETEFSIVVLDAASLGAQVTVEQEQAMRENIVPAVFFRALESGNVAITDMEGVLELTTELLHWVRTEVRVSVLGMLGMTP